MFTTRFILPPPSRFDYTSPTRFLHAYFLIDKTTSLHTSVLHSKFTVVGMKLISSSLLMATVAATVDARPPRVARPALPEMADFEVESFTWTGPLQKGGLKATFSGRSFEHIVSLINLAHSNVSLFDDTLRHTRPNPKAREFDNHERTALRYSCDPTPGNATIAGGDPDAADAAVRYLGAMPGLCSLGSPGHAHNGGNASDGNASNGSVGNSADWGHVNSDPTPPLCFKVFCNAHMAVWLCNHNGDRAPVSLPCADLGRHVQEVVVRCSHNEWIPHRGRGGRYERKVMGEDVDAYDERARDAEGRELHELIKKIDTHALEARASQLRQAVSCSIPCLQYDRAVRSSVMGGMNYHIPLYFEDGVTWIARIRRFNATSPPPAVRDLIIKSEVATLKFLEGTTVPAPKIYDHALESSPLNDVGVGFILMEKLPGKSLRWPLADGQKKEKLMGQLADIFVEIRKHPFDSLGSLFDGEGPGEIRVGTLARESLVDVAESADDVLTMGPFSSLAEYHESSIRLVLDLILRDEMYTEQSVDAYLIHRFLLDLIPQVLPPSTSSDGHNQRFYLKHADDKGDHIMVDDDSNITGIIDWEWAHTAPAALAFNSPVAFLPVSDFYDGDNTLGDDETVFARLLKDEGHADLAGFVTRGRLQHRFAFCCGYDLADWSGFLGLFQGLREAVRADEGLDWDEWRGVAMRRYEGDEGLQMLRDRHDPGKS